MAMTVVDSVEQIRLEESARDPIPPFTYNVYIAHSLTDATLVSGAENSLCKILEERFNIKCLPRHLPGSGDSAIKPIIDRGVWSSEKCLILYTDNYHADPYRSYEIELIHGKARSCSNDMVIVFWLDQRQKAAEFDSYAYDTGCSNLTSLCNNEEKLSWLARTIIKPPVASLTCLPKENIGYGAATGFFYGFLRLVLPDFRSRFRDATISDAAAVPDMLKDTVCKMLIILPLSCFCATEIKDGNRIENVKDLFVKRWANRAGNVKRDYKSSVYKLTDQSSQKEYYFAGELATPLLTMYESYSNGLLGMTLDQLYRERDIFCFTLHQVLQHPENKGCNNQYRIIMWDDRKNMNGDFGTPLYELLLPILKDELAKEKREQEIASRTPTTITPSNPESDAGTVGQNNVAKSDGFKTFEHIDVGVQSMTAIFERSQFESYPLRNDIQHGFRGKALIINIINYSVASDTAAAVLSTRTGADKDGAKMENLFRDLGFETETHQDVSLRRLEELLMFYSGSVNHTDYDAFICCIMTHGNLGEIFTSDGLPYRILDVVDMFSPTKCKSLRGKPKLFFVQSCQKRPSDSDSATNSTALQREYRGKIQTDDSSKIQTDADIDKPRERAGDRAEASGAASATGGNETGATGGNETGATGGNETGATGGNETGGSGTGACRQTSSGSNSSWEFLTPESKAMLVPGEPDILMSYSALPGSISYRDPQHGSLYIDALATNLRKDWEIDRALKRVTEDVTKKLTQHAQQNHTTFAAQLPFHLSTGMSKMLFLTPIKP